MVEAPKTPIGITCPHLENFTARRSWVTEPKPTEANAGKGGFARAKRVWSPAFPSHHLSVRKEKVVRAEARGLSPVTREVAGSIPASIRKDRVAQRLEHLIHSAPCLHERIEIE